MLPSELAKNNASSLTKSPHSAIFVTFSRFPLFTTFLMRRSVSGYVRLNSLSCEITWLMSHIIGFLPENETNQKVQICSSENALADGGGGRGCQGRESPSPSNSFIFMQFLGKNGRIIAFYTHLWSWCPLRNSGSATEMFPFAAMTTVIATIS